MVGEAASTGPCIGFRPLVPTRVDTALLYNPIHIGPTPVCLIKHVTNTHRQLQVRCSKNSIQLSHVRQRHRGRAGGRSAPSSKTVYRPGAQPRGAGRGLSAKRRRPLRHRPGRGTTIGGDAARDGHRRRRPLPPGRCRAHHGHSSRLSSQRTLLGRYRAKGIPLTRSTGPVFDCFLPSDSDLANGRNSYLTRPSSKASDLRATISAEHTR